VVSVEHEAFLRRAREQFLSTGTVPPGVRESTARSWRRSLSAGVSPDAVLAPFDHAIDNEGSLLRAARPVIEDLFRQMPDSGAAVILVDDTACVLERWASDPVTLRSLDDIQAAPGHVFEEMYVGNTALGTVIEEGRPTAVIGSEHFVRNLQQFSAVGAPIRHPITGRFQGVVDVILPAAQSSALMLPLILHTADEVAARLLSGYAALDRCLLDGFLRTDRHGPRGPTIAVNARILMSNSEASGIVGSNDHAVLWEQVRRAMGDGVTDAELVLRPDVAAIPAKITTIRDVDAAAGAVVQLRPDRDLPAHGRVDGPERHSDASGVLDALRTRLPGRSVAWRATLRRAHKAAVAGQPVLLIGERGVGKRLLATTLCELTVPSLRLAELDARDAAGRRSRAWIARLERDATEPETCVVVLHGEALDADTTDALGRLLDRVELAGRPLFVTLDASATGSARPGWLAERAPYVIELPPLRTRAEDIGDLAQVIVTGMDTPSPMRLDPLTVRRLMERDWPGNVRQLRRVLEAAVAAAPGTVVRPHDLPDGLRARAARRTFSRLEWVEREAISEALLDAAGNKRMAARALGISRSTLYRKLQALDLED
jgi:sigma-54 dependent transcriptional regulator, acetoin dehydrogenase operon transcriptional activator AcoR